MSYSQWLRFGHVFFFPSLLCMVLMQFSCQQKTAKPDTSGIVINLETKRFEKDFFSLDTNNLEPGMQKLQEQYPEFLPDYIGKILGLQAVDSALWNKNIVAFIRDYKPIYDSTLVLDKNLMEQEKELREALKYVRHYFPGYPLPKQFITFIGPMDAFAYGETGGYGEVITPTALCTGLQLHLGANSMFYQSEQGMQLYPAYISRKFSTAYISINCIKNIIDDLVPPLPSGKNMLEIMVDHGKRMYLMDLFMPDLDEVRKMRYTDDQLKAAETNEGLIWNYFAANKLLYESDYLKIRSFVSDGPYTLEFGEGSPGFISLFTGKQIVGSYMERQPNTTIDALLSLGAQEILQGAAYKPR
jgi:hypothetical protein